MLIQGGIRLGGGESCEVFRNGSPLLNNVSTVDVHRQVGGKIFPDAVFGRVVPISISFLAPGEADEIVGRDSEDSGE